MNIDVGMQAPDFALSDQTGAKVALGSYRGKWVVIYFYPADFTPGCTAESCAFRDSTPAFESAGAEIIGISSDTVESHAEFAKKYSIKHKLLSDIGGAVRSAYGVGKTLWLIPGRVTFVVDPGGIVRHRFDSQFQPKQHIDEALKAISGGK